MPFLIGHCAVNPYILVLLLSQAILQPIQHVLMVREDYEFDVVLQELKHVLLAGL